MRKIYQKFNYYNKNNRILFLKFSKGKVLMILLVNKNRRLEKVIFNHWNLLTKIDCLIVLKNSKPKNIQKKLISRIKNKKRNFLT